MEIKKETISDAIRHYVYYCESEIAECVRMLGICSNETEKIRWASKNSRTRRMLQDFKVIFKPLTEALNVNEANTEAWKR